MTDAMAALKSGYVLTDQCKFIVSYSYTSTHTCGTGRHRTGNVCVTCSSSCLSSYEILWL